MFAGFIPLLFNPHFWGAVFLTAMVSFSGGFLKGWSASSADQWRQAAIAAGEAAKAKEKLAEADRQRAEKAEGEAARLDAALESFIHETKATVCRPDPEQLKRLQQLASTGR
jgi:hypothetical protein